MKTRTENLIELLSGLAAEKKDLLERVTKRTTEVLEKYREVPGQIVTEILNGVEEEFRK